MSEIPVSPLDTPRSIIRTSFLSVWSTLYCQPGESIGYESRLFTTPRGQCGQGKRDFRGLPAAFDRSDTNLKEGGRLSDGLAATFSSVEWEVYHNDRQYARDVASFGQWSFDFTQTLIDGDVLSATPFEIVEPVDGMPSFDDVAYVRGRTLLDPHVQIPSYTTFSILLFFGADAPPVPKWGGPLRIRMILRGKYVLCIG